MLESDIQVHFLFLFDAWLHCDSPNQPFEKETKSKLLCSMTLKLFLITFMANILYQGGFLF